MTTLAEINRQIALLQSRRAKMVNRELAGLHVSYGFSSAEDFINAIRTANTSSNAGSPQKKRKPRAVITDAIRSAVLANPQKLTIAQLAKKHDISAASVMNIRARKTKG